MRESFLHYVWQQKLFYADGISTVDGNKIEIIDIGKFNSDAGPDFFNAKVKIGETVWAGNVEIHLSSSTWEKHLHHLDKAYDSVVLHVVEKADKNVYRSDGSEIPQLELKYPIKLLTSFENLLINQQQIACSDKIAQVSDFHIQSWKNTLLTERLEMKIQLIEDLLEKNNNHWEEAFYIVLARNFGFGVNGQAFEMLARSISLSALGKHKDDLLAIEALFFGQAGLLKDAEDDYVLKLKKEYEFLKAKFKFNPMDASQWKLLRLRPDNFPHVRIAQFASLIHSSSKLFSKIVENPTLEYLQGLLACKPSMYWETHYLFGNQHVQKQKKLGGQSINLLIINTIVPFLFSYSKAKGDDLLKDKAINLLEQIPSEKNAIINNFNNLGITSESAYDSQALIQLRKEYCDKKNCLRCRIGHKVLTLPVQA